MKALGGIDFDSLHQFAVAHEGAYSFVKVESFSRRTILDERDQLRDAKDNAYRKYTPGHLIIKYVTDHMIKTDYFKDLVIVFRGQIWDHFAHAATFKQFTYNGVKQVAFLDCKNDIKLFIGKKQPDQDVEQVRPDEDIEGKHYYQWDLYALVSEEIDKEDYATLKARQKFILTGDNSFTDERRKESAAYFREGKKITLGRKRATLYKKKSRSRNFRREHSTGTDHHM